MKYRVLGRTGIQISAVTYGGIVSAGEYDKVTYPEYGQAASDHYVSWAIDRGVNYFDVAPSYGNAESQLGNSLKPYRNQVYLACKTQCRNRADAEKELQESLKLQEATVGSAFSVVEGYGLDLPELVVSQYESIVREKLPQILETLHLSRIVEDRINAMEVAEVEELVMSIMKKELGAVVNLGALIGLLLGLVNVAILCL